MFFQRYLCLFLHNEMAYLVMSLKEDTEQNTATQISVSLWRWETWYKSWVLIKVNNQNLSSEITV